MRIVPYDEFAALPAGTVFAFFDPQPEYPELTVNGLHVKVACIPELGKRLVKVVFSPLTFPILQGKEVGEDNSPFHDYQDAHLAGEETIRGDYASQMVESCDTDEQFLIYDRDDIGRMITRLHGLMAVAIPSTT